MLTSDEINRMECIVKVLKPLAHATTLLCEEKTPSLSIVQAVLTVLEKKHLVNSDLEPNLTLDMKNAILMNMKAHFSDAEQHKVMLMASALDPRYKALKFLKTVERDAVYANITNAATALKSEDADFAEVPQPKCPKLAQATMDLLYFAELSPSGKSSDTNGSSPLHFRYEIEREVHYYRAEQPIEKAKDP